MISLLGPDAKVFPGNHNSNLGSDKSIVDDFVASSYCKCESILVIRSTEVFAAFLRFVLSCYSIRQNQPLQVLEEVGRNVET